VQVQPDARALAELVNSAASGGLIVRVADVLPLDRFRDGYARSARGGAHAENRAGSLTSGPWTDSGAR